MLKCFNFQAVFFKPPAGSECDIPLCSCLNSRRLRACPVAASAAASRQKDGDSGTTAARRPRESQIGSPVRRYSKVVCPAGPVACPFSACITASHNGPAHAIQDRCAQQKGLDAGRLPIQHLFHQVVQHEMMAAGKGLR